MSCNFAEKRAVMNRIFYEYYERMATWEQEDEDALWAQEDEEDQEKP